VPSIPAPGEDNVAPGEDDIVWSNESRLFPPGPLGDGSKLTALVLHFVNGPHHLPPAAAERGGPRRFVFDAGPWHMLVDQLHEPSEDLKRCGGYAITHVAKLERADGKPFDVNTDECERFLDAVAHVMSFGVGAMMGRGLAVGFDEHGAVMWVDWRISVVDTWVVRVSWLDAFQAADLAPLVSEWFTQSADPFWSKVLKRLVRYVAAANKPDPIDVAAATAHSGLDLMAWAVLVVDQGVLKTGKVGTAAARLRRLLQHASIAPTVPALLPALHARAAKLKPADAPSAFNKIRNQVVHPPRHHLPVFPKAEELQDAWRLALEWLELLLLHRLKHRGVYSSRVYEGYRAVGATELVPWANTNESGTADA
jgi:hypothetical protein